MSVHSCLEDSVIDNASGLPDSLVDEWGENELWSPFDGAYEVKTTVSDGNSAIDAFQKYTEYFEHVLSEWTPDSNRLVLVPCGATKPIGASSIHQKKLTAIRDGGLSDADVIVISEPCVVVPPEYRLSLPAVNYDFPPEYTVQDDYPEVFEVFTDRLATWLDECDYDAIYPYLISGHQSKFDAAYQKMESSPDVFRIPSASYNPDSDSYSGDMFKSQGDMTQKVRAVCSLKAEQDVFVDSSYLDFFSERWSDG